MGTRIGLAATLTLGAMLTVAACGGSSKTPGADGSNCTPGARICDGLNVKICNADGRAETVAETCLPSQSCSDGACTGTSCVPNTRFCRDGGIWKCSSTGDGSSLAQMCATSQFCLEQDDYAECSDAACFADEPMCRGDFATSCKPDGSGAKPGGTDCAATGQTCYQGKCRDKTCTAGEKLCQGDDVYLCAANGTETSLLNECGADEVCDGAMGACRPALCSAGTLDCDATRVVKCNAYGSGWEQTGPDCAASNEVCLAGTCQKQTCTPSSTFCQNGNVFQCSTDGVTSSLSQTCTPDYYHCEQYPSSNYATCASNQCYANQLFCDGNVLKTCSATGLIPATGTDCGTEKFCEDKSCHTKECAVPYAYACKDGDIRYCANYKFDPFAQQDCPSETTCKGSDGNVSCVAVPCSAGTKACLGNQVGTCAANGESLSVVTEDCTLGGNVCTADAKCAATVEDVIAVSEEAEVINAGELIGNTFEVTADRKLTEITANLLLASPRELRWVVFERSGASYVAKIDKVVSNQSGPGPFSSGAFNYTLKAGRRYLIGVAIAGGNAIAYTDRAPWNANVSFGTAMGELRSSYASIIYDNSFYEYLLQMTVKTQLP